MRDRANLLPHRSNTRTVENPANSHLIFTTAQGLAIIPMVLDSPWDRHNTLNLDSWDSGKDKIIHNSKSKRLDEYPFEATHIHPHGFDDHCVFVHKLLGLLIYAVSI